VLVVEQHVSAALEVAERAYVMAQGRLVIRGRTADLRTRRDLLMACYLGDIDAAAQLTADVDSGATAIDVTGTDVSTPDGVSAGVAADVAGGVDPHDPRPVGERSFAKKDASKETTWQ
jgi:hypothetical protein